MSRPRRADETKEGADKPLRTDARRNRERVVSSARKLFEQRGVGVEMDEIARKAGVGVGTIYRHFPTKESLIQSVAASYMESLLEGALARADAADPGAAFFEYLEFVSDEMWAKQSLGHAITASHSGPDASGKREAFRAAFDRLLERAQEAGAVRGGVTTPDLMLLMKGTILSGPDAAARRRLFEIVRDGLRA